jgi:hypothetical protein
MAEAAPSLGTSRLHLRNTRRLSSAPSSWWGHHAATIEAARVDGGPSRSRGKCEAEDEEAVRGHAPSRALQRICCLSWVTLTQRPLRPSAGLSSLAR